MTTMSAAQLILMAVIMVALMALWLTLVFLADREPRRSRRAPAWTSPGARAGAASREGTALVPPPRPPGDGETGPGEAGKALRSGVARRSASRAATGPGSERARQAGAAQPAGRE